MKDGFGREINYMRISLTQRCMLHCVYCDPEGEQELCSRTEAELTDQEILTVVKAAAALGITHIRLTGGEPLLRKKLSGLVKEIRGTRGIESVTLTTNGLLLERYLPELTEAGLNGVNISLDTVDPGRYAAITGTAGLNKVIDGIRAAVSSGLKTKINAVSIEGNAENYLQLLDYFESLPVDVRFIELMPIGGGSCLQGLSHEILLAELRKHYPGMEEDPTVHGIGPAVYYRVPGRSGAIGLISAASAKFCSSCNRIRLTADGYLKPCLCYEEGVDLRPVLRAGGDPTELLQKQIMAKPAAHCFEDRSRITEKRKMSRIGG